MNKCPICETLFVDTIKICPKCKAYLIMYNEQPSEIQTLQPPHPNNYDNHYLYPQENSTSLDELLYSQNDQDYDNYEETNIFKRKKTWIIIGAIVFAFFLIRIMAQGNKYCNGYDTKEDAVKAFASAWEEHDLKGLEKICLPPELLNPELESDLTLYYNYAQTQSIWGTDTYFSTLDQIFEYEFYVKPGFQNDNRAMNISSIKYGDSNNWLGGTLSFIPSEVSKGLYARYGVNESIDQSIDAYIYLEDNSNYPSLKNNGYEYDEYLVLYNANGKWFVDFRRLIPYYFLHD